MAKTPAKAAFSARLQSHSAWAEVRNDLKTQAFQLLGGRFHGPCRPMQTQGFDGLAADPEDAANDGSQLPRPNVRCGFAAAFGRRHRAQSRLLVVSLTAEESTANIGALRRKQWPLCGSLPNFGVMPVRDAVHTRDVTGRIERLGLRRLAAGRCAATWPFGKKARLGAPWAFAVSAMNCVGTASTV